MDILPPSHPPDIFPVEGDVHLPPRAFAKLGHSPGVGGGLQMSYYDVLFGFIFGSIWLYFSSFLIILYAYLHKNVNLKTSLALQCLSNHTENKGYQFQTNGLVIVIVKWKTSLAYLMLQTSLSETPV